MRLLHCRLAAAQVAASNPACGAAL
jgi:hypothetical protein